MPEWEDYYKTLGVDLRANQEDIKRAYRDKQWVLHPDRMRGAPETARRRAEEELKRLNRAYEVLTDPQQRSNYDKVYGERVGTAARPPDQSQRVAEAEKRAREASRQAEEAKRREKEARRREDEARHEAEEARQKEEQTRQQVQEARRQAEQAHQRVRLGARLLAIAAMLVTALVLAKAQLPNVLPKDWDITRGHFFTQGALGGLPGYGYAVTNDHVAPFLTEFRRLGGVNAVGYPISRRFLCGGYVCQAFQKVILRWYPQDRQASPTNLFEELSSMGLDGWLGARWSAPKPVQFREAGLGWDKIIDNRLKLLDSDPEIKGFYFKTSTDWLRFNGLPMAPIAEYRNVRVLRAQRVVIQHWLANTASARAGQVVLANAGEMAREAGLIPAEALESEAPGNYESASLWPKIWTWLRPLLSF